jgi:L-arabinose isomerase
MNKPKVGFVVYGVHKDGLLDPMGEPFIDDELIAIAKEKLRDSGLELIEYELIIATKEEAKACFAKFKGMPDVGSVVLFSGTWVWAAHLLAAVRDYTLSGKAVVFWTHPGSQGWRPVGGLVMHGALNEVDIRHRFVYGSTEDERAIQQIVSYVRAAHEKARLNMSTMGALGGRGMGQSCGVADPSQWMKHFGIDIDSRDTTELISLAKKVTDGEVTQARKEIQTYFAEPIPEGEVADRSIRLYIAVKKLVEKENWEFYTIQSFPGLADDYSATCLAQSMMLENGFGTSTLSDFNTALTVKLITDMSDERVYYGDLQHIDLEAKEVKIIGDGTCPPSLACAVGPAKFAEHGIPTEGEAGGLSISLVCKAGEGVLARLGRRGGKFELAIARCSIFEPSAEEIETRRHECNIPFWPHAFVTVHADMQDFVQAWNNEYAVLGYGEHLYDDLIAFCEMTGIEPIAL